MTSTIEIRDAREYTVNMRDESGGQEERTITVGPGTEAEQDAQAMREAQEETESWVRECDEYGDEGASVRAWFALEDDESEWPEKSIEVEIEPNHEALIRAAMGDEGCGLNPDDHDWTAEGEGGLTENPGVWAGSGTSMTFRTHCTTCGLQRREVSTGSQRNPGEHDTVEYFAPEQEVEHA